MYRINIFSLFPPPIKEYALYTQFNIDNYGQPLNYIEESTNKNNTISFKGRVHHSNNPSTKQAGQLT